MKTNNTNKPECTRLLSRNEWLCEECFNEGFCNPTEYSKCPLKHMTTNKALSTTETYQEYNRLVITGDYSQEELINSVQDQTWEEWAKEELTCIE